MTSNTAPIKVSYTCNVFNMDSSSTIHWMIWWDDLINGERGSVQCIAANRCWLIHSFPMLIDVSIILLQWKESAFFRNFNFKTNHLTQTQRNVTQQMHYIIQIQNGKPMNESNHKIKVGSKIRLIIYHNCIAWCKRWIN